MEMSSPYSLLRHREDSSSTAGSTPLTVTICLDVFGIDLCPNLLKKILNSFFSVVLIKCSEEKMKNVAFSTAL